MDLFEFYKELYHKENDRKQEVVNALNIPIAIITAISTANYLFVTTFDYTFNKTIIVIFVLMVTVAVILLIISIVYLINAFIGFKGGYDYLGLPLPGDLNKWHDELKNYNSVNNIVPDNSDEVLKAEILKNLLSSTDHNTYVNDKKQGYIYNSKKFLVASLIISLIILFPFGIDYFNKKDSIFKVNIIQQKGLTIECKK